MSCKRNSFVSVLLIILLISFSLIWGYKNSVKHIETDRFDVNYLSSESVVISYIKDHKKLPDYFIRKKEAKEYGWSPEEGNLCEVLPGKVIGGDIFTNRQQIVPEQKGRFWVEADLNYNCGRRGKDRVVFSNDGLIFVTKDHYQTFQQR